MILEASVGSRELSAEQLHDILEHVANAGFDPNAREVVRDVKSALRAIDEMLEKHGEGSDGD